MPDLTVSAPDDALDVRDAAADADALVRRSLAAYDEHAAAYQKAYRRRRSRVDVHRFAAMAEPDALVLDAGCGPASDMRLLRDAGVQPVGVDLSMGVLTTARMLLPRDPLVRADYDELPFRAACFGGLWLSGSLDHTPRGEWDRVLDRFFALLERGPVHFSCVRGRADLRPFQHPVLGDVAVSAATEQEVGAALSARGVVDLQVEVRPEPLMERRVPLVVASGRVR